MALDTYAELVDALASWPSLEGEDSLQAAIPTLISLAEAQINQDSRLRLQSSLFSQPYSETTAIDEYDLPADCLQVDYVQDAAGQMIQLTTLDRLYAMAGPCRKYYAIDGLKIRFSEPLTDFTLRYYRRPPSLESADNHWLYFLAPDLYLYGALIQAAIFNKEDPRETQRYGEQYERCVARLEANDWNARLASQTLKTR